MPHKAGFNKLSGFDYGKLVLLDIWLPHSRLTCRKHLNRDCILHHLRQLLQSSLQLGLCAGTMCCFQGIDLRLKILRRHP